MEQPRKENTAIDCGPSDPGVPTSGKFDLHMGVQLVQPQKAMAAGGYSFKKMGCSSKRETINKHRRNMT